MNKAELEEHRERYDARMSQAETCANTGLHREALGQCVYALAHVDGMMRHAQRYDSAVFANVAAIQTVLKLGPLLLSIESLDALETTLKTCQRIERETSEDLGAMLRGSRMELALCVRFWGYLEEKGGLKIAQLPHFSADDQAAWKRICQAWLEMGLVCRTSEAGGDRISIVSHFDRLWRGKCSRCGGTEQRRKREFYNSITCRHCGKKSMLTLQTG